MHQVPSFHIPIFIINVKSYIWGKRSLKLAKIIEKVAKGTKVYLCMVPQLVDIASISEQTCVPVFAPHMDSIKPGRGTGRILPEAIREAGAVGVLLNHSENKLTITEISNTIKRAREVGLITMVCSSTPEEAGVIAKLRPDAVIVEPPHLIGTLKSVGREREFVIRSIKVVKDIDPKIALICGAGISSGKDVMELIRLGVDGTGASRSICESKEPYKLLIEITRAMEDEWQSKIVRA